MPAMLDIMLRSMRCATWIPARVIAACAALWLLSAPIACGAEEDSARIARDEFERQMLALDPTPARHDALEAAYKSYVDEYDAAHQMQYDLWRWLSSNLEYGGSGNWYGGQQSETFHATADREYKGLKKAWETGWRMIEARYYERMGEIAPGREEAIASLRRLRLRHRLFNDPYGYILGGAETDLITICDRIAPALADDAVARDAMLTYELSLDWMLRTIDEESLKRDELLKQQADAIAAARAAGKDVTALQAERRLTSMAPVRHSYAMWLLQESSSRRIAETVQDFAARADLEEAFHVALRPWLKPERGITPETAFEEALARADLTVEQRNRLQALRDSYRGDRRAATRRIDASYLRACDPTTYDEVVRLYQSGETDEALRLQSGPQTAWDQVHSTWLERCIKVIKSINDIVAETQPREPTP